MWSAWVVLLAATAASPNRVQGGEEVELSWDQEIVHARADAGDVVGWQGTRIRWRAPSVCAAVRTRVHLQTSDASESTLEIDVEPAEPSELVLLGGPAATAVELHFARASDSDVPAVSVGWTAPLPSSGRCGRARWERPPAPWPDWAAVAVFSGAELVAWAKAPRSAMAPVKVAARPGGRVAVRVAERVFPGRAGPDGQTNVLVEVPPGIDHAEVQDLDATGRKPPLRLALSPPAPTTDHRLMAPAGGEWLLRSDRLGRPIDGTPPEGAHRWGVGAFRLGGPPREAAASPPPETVDEVPPDGVPEAGVARSNATLWGFAATTGPSLRPGIAVFVRRTMRRGVWAPGFGAATLAGARWHSASAVDGSVVQASVALLGWAELGLPVPLGAGWVAPSIGLGGGSSLRSAVLGSRASHRWYAGPMGRMALSVGAGAWALDVSGLVSTVSLGTELSKIVLSAGVSRAW